MTLPVILIYSQADGRAAFRTATATHRAIEARVPASVASALGAPVLASLVGHLAPLANPSGSRIVIDCGDETGLALAVLRAGVPFILSAISGIGRKRLLDICESVGATLIDDEQALVLDLARVTNPSETCLKWLESAV